MSRLVLIVHAEGEDERAEELAAPIREAGYEVWHQGEVRTGESVPEEASKVLSTGAPLVLCGTEKAVARAFTHRFIHAARARNNRISIFPVKMDQHAYVEQISFDGTIADYWQDKDKAISDLIASLKKHYPQDESIEAELLPINIEETYRQLALESFDIIDLDNLPDVDRTMLRQRIDFRRLYVTLRVQEEPVTTTENDARTSKATERLAVETSTLRTKEKEKQTGIPVGRELANARQLVILGDAGSGKTTMLRWIASACLLRLSKSDGWTNFPDIETLPKEDWLPIIIRCRELEKSKLLSPLEDLLRHTLRRLEIPSADVDILSGIFMRKLALGKVLLLVDGLDEITDPAMRADLCKQLEGIHVAHKLAPIVVTSRTAGYREMGCRIGRGFKHLIVSDLSKEDKDYFARQWCAITATPGEKETATNELIKEIHSTDRIERLTRNPMLLTTMALVKRKGGKLPGNRVDLYWAALDVLLNWRSRVDKPLEWREAGPQLEYLAFTMCDLGVQQLREDEILTLLESLRRDFPSLYSVQAHTPDEFLRLLERRTGILMQAGTETFRGRDVKLYEFRHLTFQEYLAALALVDGYCPIQNNKKSLAEVIAPLAGRTIEEKDPDSGSRESVVTENWREALRLCITICDHRDVDNLFRAILQPLENENPQITARPRAVLAALCLADDPNGVTKEMASEVLSALIKNINIDDGRSYEATSEDSVATIRTSLDVAVKELARSRWAWDASRFLIDEFRSRDAMTRWRVGCLAGVVASPILKDQSEAISWLKNQESLISSEEEYEAIRVALAIRTTITRRQLYPTVEIIDALLNMLTKSGPAAHAAASALNKFHDSDENNEYAWSPSSSQVVFCADLLRDSSYDLGAVSFLIRLLGREGDNLAVEPLISRLNDENPTLRRIAIEALGKIGDVRVVESLLIRLNDEAPAVREATALALGTLKDERAIEPLIERLSDESVPVQSAAISALGFFKGRKVETTIISRLDSPDFRIRNAAIKALSIIDLNRFIDYVIAGLEDESKSVRLTAVQQLVSANGERIEESLISRLDDRDAEVRANAAITLGLLKSYKASEVLISKLDDESENVQGMAAYSLGQIADTDQAEPIINALIKKVSKGSEDAQFWAALALHNINDDRKIEPLLRLLNDKDYGVRSQAISALGESGHRDVFDALINMLEDESLDVRKHALEALGVLKDSRAVEPLLLRLEDEDALIRTEVVEALGKIGDGRAVKSILVLLNDDVPTVRVAVIDALAELKDRCAITPLLHALGDYHTYIRPLVVEALGAFEDRAVVPPLLDRLENDSSAVRAAIVEVLGNIGDETIEPILIARLNDTAVSVRVASKNALRDTWLKWGMDRFSAGDITGASDKFERIVELFPDDDNTRNNVLFCSLLLKRYDKAAEHASSINFSEYLTEKPLWQNNRALLSYLTGELDTGLRQLRMALSWINEAGSNFNPHDVYAILLLDKREGVSSFQGIPIDAAILINLYLMKGDTLENLLSELSKRYPSEYEDWLDVIEQLNGEDAK